MLVLIMELNESPLCSLPHLSFFFFCCPRQPFFTNSQSATLPKENKEHNLPIPPILLITPPPIDEKKWDYYCIENYNELSPRSNHSSKAYGDRVKSVAKDLGCLVVDAFALLGGDHVEQEAYYGQNLEDGLHLSDLGNKLLYDVSTSC
jgi:lysophospholipase L1-like esterase